MSESWPVIWPSTVKVDQYSNDELERAASLATSVLRSLTLSRVGPVRVVSEPCGSINVGTYEAFHASVPHFVTSSRELKCHCMVGCGCKASPYVKLIAPVSEIHAVMIDGEQLDQSEYEVVGGAYLRREDGSWPICRGDFIVDYSAGYPVSKEGQHVAGLLAEEFLMGFADPEKCRLPRGVTEITRQGVTLTVDGGLFPNGQTGIPEVDAFIFLWNPFNMKVRPRVYSPDMPKSGASW